LNRPEPKAKKAKAKGADEEAGDTTDSSEEAVEAEERAHENEDLCRACGRDPVALDADLLLCDSCPAAFHGGCLGLSAAVASSFWA